MVEATVQMTPSVSAEHSISYDNYRSKFNDNINNIILVLPGKAVQYQDYLFSTENSHPPVTPEEKGFTGQVLRVSKGELEMAGVWHDDVVELENGGYMASLGVMHEFHCLVSQRRTFPLLRHTVKIR